MSLSINLNTAAAQNPGNPSQGARRSSPIVLAALQRALDELPQQQREVFIAHEIDGSSYKDMSRSSGTPVNTLLARKRSAILHLRARLQPVYDDLEL